MTRRLRRNKFLLGCAVVLFALIQRPVVLAAPEIARIEPQAVAPGKKTVLTLSGSNLESVSNLWTSFGGEAQRVVNTNEGQISFAVVCPEEASGVQAIQAFDTDGASGFRLILVDSLQSEAHANNHQSPSTALRLSPPTAVDALLKSEKIDYYQFGAKAREVFSIEVIAHRIGSQMDPVARVLDKDGHEIVFCDDEGSTWNDARFQFVAPAEGTYTLAVHDVGYGGGKSFFYRLRATKEPLIWFTFPLVDPSERTIPLERLGSGLKPWENGSPANPNFGPALSLLPQTVETEPNDVRSGVAATAPVILNGKIGSAGDVDVFPFIAAKDQKLVFQSQTRSLGSPCDLVLRIKGTDDKTKIIGQSEMNSAIDAALTNQFSEAGEYLLEVRELSGAGGTNLPYRIKIQEFAPGFNLTSEKNRLELKEGESAKLTVKSTRAEYDGPIELYLEPSVPGLTLESSVIPEKKNEVELVFKTAEAAAPGNFHHLKIIGKATNGFSRAVSTKPALKNSFPLMLNPPPDLDGIFTVTVKAR